MLDRLEIPIEFLESMRTTNFIGEADWQIKALGLTEALERAVRSNSAFEIQKWIDKINFDPEMLGSAFFMVYRFALDYKQKCLANGWL